MKKLILTTFVSIVTFITFAETNNNSILDTTPRQVGAAIKTATGDAVKAVGNSVATTTGYTNVNQGMIDMLSGVKDAGHEIYGASKEIIHKSVDFVQEQAPDVVKQFLTWQFFHALIWACIWLAIAGVLYFLAYKLKQYQPKASTKESQDAPSDHAFVVFFKWITIMAASFLIIIGVGTESFEMVKIKVAPKVYIIEYVVNLVQEQSHH